MDKNRLSKILPDYNGHRYIGSKDLQEDSRQDEAMNSIKGRTG
jgi:hypothetical protein